MLKSEKETVMRTQNAGKGEKPKNKTARIPKSAVERIRRGKVELSEDQLAKVTGGAKPRFDTPTE
jgi:bacteriocin-like protein